MLCFWQNYPHTIFNNMEGRDILFHTQTFLLLMYMSNPYISTYCGSEKPFDISERTDWYFKLDFIAPHSPWILVGCFSLLDLGREPWIGKIRSRSRLQTHMIMTPKYPSIPFVDSCFPCPLQIRHDIWNPWVSRISTIQYVFKDRFRGFYDLK